MLASSRRVFWYWLLLFIPSIVIGGGALLLLRREQTRFAQRAESAEQARRAALDARTRLVAENVSLLLGDIEDGLLDTLVEVPDAELSSFLDQWPGSQPLVRLGFIAKPSGKLVKPTAETGGDDARGFYRRFASSFMQAPPWASVRQDLKENKVAQSPQKLTFEDDRAREQVLANTNRLQNARREAKSLVQSVPPPSKNQSSFSKPWSAETKDVASAAGAAAPSKNEQAVRRGWTARKLGEHVHVIGWVTRDGDDVRGLEMELAALVPRLGNALPVDLESGQSVALRDERHRVLHQVGGYSRLQPEPTVHVPLDDPAFPGWEVVGYLEPAVYGSSGDGTGLFVFGALLVGIFTVAILSGGSLLLLQARRSEAEATQKTSFVANVSHEFKTPLTTIRLYSELLEQGRVAEENKRREYLATIGRETQRLARLVNNVLDFSRLEQGRKKYQFESLDLRSELIRIVDTQHPRLAEVPLAVFLEVPDEQVPLSTDRDAFEQILLNLLDNACKYAAAGGEVRIGLRSANGGRVLISIADRGPGVPPEHRERIFEKFHRVDETLTAEKPGAGLGLSIARQLARGLGGDLRYEPREGGGAVFRLSL